MKSVYSFLILLVCLSTAGAVFAQTHTPRYVSMASNTKGYYEYLPEGYHDNPAATYPLILFMTGIGEFGNGTTQLGEVLTEGLPKVIEAGTFPKSFNVNGETHRFIVITPQFLARDKPTADDMNVVLDYIVSHYRVDLNRIYITGLSYGGGLSFAYAGANDAYAQRVAAIVPIASPIPDGGDATIYARSRVIARNNVAVWATHNRRDQDDTVATTIAYVNYINEPPAPTPPAKMTIFDAGGHNAWTRTYNPANKEFGGLNIYEWMLQNKRTVAAPNTPPVANAGTDQTITLPANSVTLTSLSTDADGNISSYAWTKVSGPAGGSITSPNAGTTTVTGLTEGSYVFRLAVTDDKGATATDEVNILVNAAPNAAPKVNAGADQNITLPTNAVTLTGTATDDGTIVSYNWAKVSGPAGTITSPEAATTTVTALGEGSYVFRLTVTDDKGATGTDDVSVIVNAAPNVAPQADAGADQAITLPANSVTLSGSGVDSDGTISSYAWAKVSGPSGGTITSPNTASTTVTSLQQGSYIFRLTVTDDKGTTASDEITVTVNAAPIPNEPPKVNAVQDKTITLPENSVTLTGTATDADGTIAQYSWTKVSGPGAGSITNPDNATTTVTGLVEGSYLFRLTVKDDDGATASDDVTIAVNAAPNKAPVANAGSDISITLPVDKVDLSGSGTDEDGTIASYLWTKVSGPAGEVITAKEASKTSVTGLVQGSYVFRLTITDDDGATAVDEVTVTVNGAANKTPVANAGADVTVTLPVNTATLSGGATDADGTIASYVWTKVSGPAQGVIATKDAAQTVLNDLAEGLYVFRLTVTDNNGAAASDDVGVTVLAAPVPNVAPVANAGADQTITLPTNTVTLTGSGTDNDGTIATYNWTKISGPDGSSIATPNADTTTVTGLQQGSYVFRLTITDNSGATATDDVSVTVNTAPPVNKAPQADAGADQGITLPVSTVTLSGSGTDSDGSIAAYAWTQVSGPASATFTSADKASTSITGLIQGSFVFRLTVTDNNGATASDDVSVTVNAAPVNQAPQANAGADQNITLPVDSVTLTGSGTDPDGTIAGYAWIQVSGPADATISTPNAAATKVKSLKQGSYLFRLTVTDNSGAMASDTVRVNITAATVIDDPARTEFNLLVGPNPAASQFFLKVTSNSTKGIYLRVTDVLGKVIEVKTTLQPNTTYRIGQNYRPGIYHAEVVQDGRRLVVKLLKVQ